jgi:hypothetical protein
MISYCVSIVVLVISKRIMTAAKCLAKQTRHYLDQLAASYQLHIMCVVCRCVARVLIESMSLL